MTRSLSALFILFFAACGFAQAQDAASTMSFERTEWNFGAIREEAGTVSCRFGFTNSGKTALAIERVVVGCGCTTPVFSKEPVLPGRTGEITVTYNPQGRPGPFSQSVVIHSNGGRNVNTLRVSGEVIPAPRPVEEEYPYDFAGGIRFAALMLNYRYVAQGEMSVMRVGYVNTSQREATLGFEVSPPNAALRVPDPVAVPAGARGEVAIAYDLTGETMYGRFSDKIYPVINGRRQRQWLSTTMTAIDGAPRDLAGAEGSGSSGSSGDSGGASLSLSPAFHPFGEVRRRDTLEKRVTLTNEGSEPLVVRWVGSGKGVRAGLSAGTTVAPGESVGFDVTFDVSSAPRGIASGSVTIITNDPGRPVRDVRLAADVR